MRHAPRETVDSWLRRPALSPRKLIPALLPQHRPGAAANSTQAIRFLNNVIFEQNSTDTTIYNLLLTLHVASPDGDDGSLLRFLSTCPDDPATERPYYDLDYALRLCKQHGRVQACVLIYSKMGLYESSVDLALEKGDLELAKMNADRPEEDDILRRKLWLKIAKYVVQEQKDIKRCVEDCAPQYLHKSSLQQGDEVSGINRLGQNRRHPPILPRLCRYRRLQDGNLLGA